MKLKNMASILLIFLVFTSVLCFGWWMYRWQYNKADTLLENWARTNNYQVLEKQNANPPGTGPDDRYAANKQVMYRVTVLEKDGKKKSGLVKIGSETTGTLSDEITVEWDK